MSFFTGLQECFWSQLFKKFLKFHCLLVIEFWFCIPDLWQFSCKLWSCFNYNLIQLCYELNVCAPSKCICWNPKLQYGIMEEKKSVTRMEHSNIAVFLCVSHNLGQQEGNPDQNLTYYYFDLWERLYWTLRKKLKSPSLSCCVKQPELTHIFIKHIKEHEKGNKSQ